MVAKGTAEQPIIFTSFKDDAHGGDTNNDSNTTQAAAGDWERIDTNGLSGSVFEYCQFFYGGSKGVDLGTLLLNDSVAIVNNCTFAHNRGGKSVDLYDGALDASDALPGTVITNNVFFDNTLPLSINLTFSLDDSNTFHNPVAPEDKNTLNGIFVSPLYGRRLKGTITWQETEVPYVINKIDLWIDAGASLTLANNVVLKFTPNRQLIYDDNFINYAGDGVAFTSFQDDTLKGDTNGDGAATSPADYDWLGIYNRNSAVDGYESGPNIHYDSH